MDLWRRCEKDKPKAEDLQAFRQMLKDTPGLWRVAGDLGRLSRNAIIRQFKVQATTFESLEHGMEELAADLGRAKATALEKLLIDQVVTSWLHLSVIQLRYTSAHTESIALPLSEYLERRLTLAQRRFLRTIEALARVRRLLRPKAAVQVNIGAQQVNVAGDVTPTKTEKPKTS